MSAVHSDLAFVSRPGNGPGCGCTPGCNPGCHGSAMVFRSVWDRLCQQLFGATPPGMDSEDQLPDINIWKDGVVLVKDTYPYSFRVMTESGEVIPKPADVILYKGKYYVIGEVDE